MIKVPHPDSLEYFNLDEFSVPPLEKFVDRRGFLYILFDEAFPDFIKVGRTSDQQRRLYAYNSDKPYNTARMLYITSMFQDSVSTEKTVLDFLYSKTPPTTLSREWFPIEYKDLILETLEKMENLYLNLSEEILEDCTK